MRFKRSILSTPHKFPKRAITGSPCHLSILATTNEGNPVVRPSDWAAWRHTWITTGLPEGLAGRPAWKCV